MALKLRKLKKKHTTPSHAAIRGVILKIQPLRNPSIFNNMICVPISKVPPMGMSMDPRAGPLGFMSSFIVHKVIF